MERTIHERDALSKSHIDLEGNMDQRVVDRIATEKARSRTLELAIDSLKAHNEENNLHCEKLEEEKAGLVRELDDLSHWKAVYEAGHGMQELARNQKKLKDDNRRLGVAVEQYNSKLSKVLDANGVLTQVRKNRELSSRYTMIIYLPLLEYIYSLYFT